MRVNSVKLGVIFVHRCVMGRDLIEAHVAFPVAVDGVHLAPSSFLLPRGPHPAAEGVDHDRADQHDADDELLPVDVHAQQD